MKFEFELTFGGMYWAVLTLISRLPIQLAVSMVFPVAGIVLLVLILWLGQPVQLDTLLLVVACFAFTPGLTALNIWLARRKNRTVAGVHTFIMDDQGIRVSGATSDLALKWPAINKVIETRRFFFFMYSSRAAQFLPERVIPPGDALQAVRDLITANHRRRANRAG